MPPKIRTIRRQLWFFGALVVAGLLFYSCGNDARQANAGGYPPRVVLLDELPVRKAPGDSAEVLELLHKGDKVYELGGVSTFTTVLYLQGKYMNEPWLNVKTEKGIHGWVYAGGFDWSADYQALFFKRLEALAGQLTARRALDLQSQYATIDQASDFAGVYRNAMGLRDTLERFIQQKIPDEDWSGFGWISNIIPGFVPAAESGFFLFADYRQWAAKARQTPQTDDDVFMELMLGIYPEDSIEYHLPVWLIQSSPGENHSLLGRGLHLQLLQKCAGIMAQSPLFEQEIRKIKSIIVNDITQAGVSYWENAARIKEEVDAILQIPGSLLSQSDLIALRTRRKQLETPEVYEIRLDVQSGSM